MKTYADHEVSLIVPGPDGGDIICLLCSSEDEDEQVAWDIRFEMEFDEHLYAYHHLELTYQGDWNYKPRVWRRA